MKKILSVLSIVMLAVLSSIVFVGCKDKYKNMNLTVQYLKQVDEDEEYNATSTSGEGEDAETLYWKWVDVEYDKGLDFVLDETNKTNEVNDYYSLICRVLVKGTKKKVDHLSISCTASSAVQIVNTSGTTGEHDGLSVKPEEEFTVRVYTTGSINMFVVPSVKADKTSVEFPINMYDKIGSITPSSEVFPAVAKGDALALELDKVKGLLNFVGANGGVTNQLEVNYSLVGASEQDGVYTLGQGEDSSIVLDTTENRNRLTVGKDVDASQVTVIVTSAHDETISCEFVVKIIDNLYAEDLNINYASSFAFKEDNTPNKETNAVNKITSNKPITLYSGSVKYKTSYIVLSGLSENESYNFASQTVKYDVKLYLDGKEVQANGETYHGVSINEITFDGKKSFSEITGVEGYSANTINSNYYKVYSITATEYNLTTTNSLEFVIGYKNLKFSGKDFSLSETGADKSGLIYNLTILREDLPTAFSINEQSLKNGASIDDVIYTKYASGGYELNVNAIRSLSKQTEVLLKIETNSNTTNLLNLYDFNGSTIGTENNAWVDNEGNTSSCYKWTAFSKNMYLKFAEDVTDYPSSLTLKFRVLASPLEFEGNILTDKEYIEVSLTLITQGSLTSVGSDKGQGSGASGDLFEDPSEHRYVQADTNLSTFINLVSDGNIAVAPASVNISSQNSSMLFSKDGIDWVYTINCGELNNGLLYFKAEKGDKDRIVITSKNGSSFNSCELQFVKTVVIDNDDIDFELDFENTYIYNVWKAYDKTNYQQNYVDGINGYYLAMQANTNADFKVYYLNEGAKNNVGIDKISPVSLSSSELPAGKNISAYGQDAVGITKFTDGNGFNLRANRTDLTTVIKIDISYYQNNNDNVIEKKEYQLYIEVALYTPASSVSATVDNGEIYYVNSRIMDKATAKFNIYVNTNASKYLYFSNDDLDSVLYPDTNKNGEKDDYEYLYTIKADGVNYSKVTINGTIIADNVQTKYIDLGTNTYQFTLTTQPEEAEYSITFTVEQFGFSTITSKKIKIVDFEKVQDIKISKTLNNNIYLALRGKENEASFGAVVSNINATYKTLDYQLFKYSEIATNHVGERVYGTELLNVEFDYNNGLVTTTAEEASGGKYILRIVSPDSFNDKTLQYTVYKDVVINVSDGTKANPFYLYTVDDVATMFSTENNENEKNYVLASDINLSRLDELTLTNNGKIDRNFAGSLTGVINYYDPEKDLMFYTQNKFTQLTVSSGGFINNNTGTLNNVVIDEVTFAVKLGSTSYNQDVTIGALVNNNEGTINNCSVYLKRSSVDIDVKKGEANENQSASYEYNIGGLVGKNSGNITFYPDDTSNYKQYSNHLQMVTFKDELTVNIINMPTTTVDHNINIGGVIGKNIGTIKGNYFNSTNKQFNQILTANVDVKINFNNQINQIDEHYLVNAGGVSGLNTTGEINQVAVTGSVIANGNDINLGAFAGQSSATISNSASYSTVVKGGAYVSSTDNSTQLTITNQNVGGGVGLSSGDITNVYVLFIDLKTFGYGEESNPTVEGMDVVGGLVGKQTAGTISFGNVQSFISTATIIANFKGNENGDGVTKAIAGLVAVQEQEGTTIEKSFVRANIKLNEKEESIDAKNITINPIATSFENCYFIGEINQNIIDTNEDNSVINANINNNVSNDSYLLILNNEEYFVKTSDSVAETGKTYYDDDGLEQTIVIGETSVVDYYEKLTGEIGTLYNGDIVAYQYTSLDGNKYFASPNESEQMSIYNEKKFFITGSQFVDLNSYFKDGTTWSTNWQDENINDRLPVLLNEGNPSLIVLAEELIVNPNINEFNPTVNATQVVLNNQGIYFTNGAERTVIVYLSQNSANNRYKLIKEDNDGLLDKQIYPTIASGEYFLEVIDGHNCFDIVGDYITFKNTGRVELKFTSLYNTNAYDTVIFFVEHGVTDFDIVKQDSVITSLRTYTNSNLNINIRGLFENGISKISANNLYLKISGNGDVIDIIDLSSFIVPNGYFSIENLQLNIGAIASKNETVDLKFELYLNTANYFIDKTNNITLSDYKFTYLGTTNDTELVTSNSILIASKNLKVEIYQSATELRVTNGSNKTDSVQSIVTTELEILTDYLVKEDTESSISKFRVVDNLLYAELGEKESFYVKMDTSSHELLEFKKSNSIWSLFNYSGIYKLNDDNTGYIYTFNLELKEEYRKVSTNLNVTLTFYARSNNIHTDVVEIVFQPQSIETFRMENFKSGVAYLSGNNVTVEYVSNETPSSIIVPGKSGLIKLFVQPYYALVDRIEISSTSVEIDGVNYSVSFQQMLYDVNSEHYLSYPGFTTEENTLRLQKNSYIDENGVMQYTGVIYVRTILDDIIGDTKTFTITATAYEYKRNEQGEYDDVNPVIKKTYPAEKMLLSQYNPGVTISVSNALEDIVDKELQLTTDEKAQSNKTYYNDKGEKQTVNDGQSVSGYYELVEVNRKVYLIEKNSNTTKLYANIYGYEFNQQPTVSITGLDGKTVSDKVYYSQGNGVLQPNGSYLVEYSIKTIDLDVPFKLTIQLQLLLNGVSVDSKSVEAVFYPVDYIPTGVYLRGSSNNILKVGVNSSKKLEMVMTSNNLTISDNANKDINKVDYFYIDKYNAQGVLVEETLDDTKEYDNFKITTNDNYVYITATGEKYQAINFYVGYNFSFDYQNNKFEIEFTSKQGDYKYHVNTTFSVDLCVVTTEEEPDTIYTAEQFLEMSTGGNYILMSDITLENWTPKLADFASLDGNGKLITIKSFNIPSSSTEIIGGLFTTISADTIVKNLAIDISSYQGALLDNTVLLADENSTATATYFGFLAGKNEGLVYNCEILCLVNQGNSNLKNITIKTSTLTSYIGGLIGLNNGNITNSRVGTEYFEKVTVNSDGTTSSNIIKSRVLSIYANGIVAGFVASNGGIISSSYFANFNIFNENKVPDDDVNMTAGFVAINSGRINTSYSKGSGISAINIRGDKSGVYAIGAGSSAGFVFTNSGTIENCYSNLMVSSSSSAVSGFVYRNNGTINQSYSASKVSSEKESSTLAIELPFVGVGIEGDEINKLLSNGSLNNCFYLEITGENADNFDKNFEFTTDMDLPVALNETNFAQADNLINFAFVDGNYEQSLQGVWTYYSTIDKNTESYKLGRTYLPELTSANQISRSVRYIVLSDNMEVEHELFYAVNYNLGSKNNPFIIRSAEEYNAIFSYSSTRFELNKFNGYVRFIDDISFEVSGEEATSVINTTLGYSLGDSDNRSLTVVDGNGMTISGVDTRNNNIDRLDSLGLFNDIYYSVVKSLTVNFVSMPYSSTIATYSGGLAGTVNDSYIIGVNLIGNNTTITARNFGGGLAGIVRGNSGLYNINSSLSVSVTHESLTTYYQYLSFEEFKKHYTELGFRFNAIDNVESRYKEYLAELSYAGGLAGVIDINSISANKVSINKITIGSYTNIGITGDIAGFVTGHLSRSTIASRLNAEVKPSSYVYGAFISAGLVAENYGRISFSQVASEDNLQFSYDKELSQYGINPSKNAIDNSTGIYGNLDFVRGETKISSVENVAGGFVGVNYGGYIDNSYTKGSISANSYYVGGFVGVNFAGIYDSVYAQNYLDVSNAKTKYIGGFTALNGKKNNSSIISKVYTVIGYNSSTDTSLLVDNLVVANFYDQADLEQLKLNKQEEKFIPKIDYMISKSEAEISSAQGVGTTSMYSYYLSYSDLENAVYSSVISKDTEINNAQNKADYDLKCEGKAIDDLYNLQDERQLEVFTSLFINYDVNVWEKDNTKFFPTLKENPLLNYYEINNESDLILMILHPDANFILNGNVNLSREYVNYVINTEFTGTLIGRIGADGKAPTISGIKIYTDDTTVTAGFFKSTNGTQITNINLSYEYLVINTDKQYVGLLSAEDTKSEFNSVSVKVENTSNTIKYTNGEITNLGDVKAYIRTDEATVDNFGGLFGDSVGTETTGCKVNVNVNLKIGAGTETLANIGGLVGVQSSTEGIGEIDGIILNSSYSGNITIINSKNRTLNVGGISGQSSKVNITSSSAEATINVNNANIGGLIGSQNNSYLYDVSTDISVSASGSAIIGGIAGLLQNDGNDNDPNINSSTAILNLDSVAGNIVGGLVGKGSSNVKLSESVAWVYGSISSGSINFGGLIGQYNDNQTDKLILIENCFALMEGAGYDSTNGVDAKGLTLSSTDVTAGGFIGTIKSENVVLNISNSFNAGALWVSSGENNGENLVLGGMIGSWENDASAINLDTSVKINPGEENEKTYSTLISNSYTALVFETSHFKMTDSLLKTEGAYIVSGILGKLPIDKDENFLIDGTIDISNVFYSSDYTLALEEKTNCFDSSPINLVARALLDAQEKEQNFKAEEGWTIETFGLPYRTVLTSKLENMSKNGSSLLARFTSSLGSSLHPTVITDADVYNGKTYYQYYFIQTDKNNTELNLTGKLNGFILGNGLSLTTPSSNSVSLKDYSVISNLKYTLTGDKIVDKLNYGGLVDENNGTVFNVTVDYYYKTSITSGSRSLLNGGGGIVKTNNGNILYCYNTGSFENIGTISNFGGITGTNSGFIVHSAFIGSGTTATDTATIGGISYSNEGAIYNTYSAGVIDTDLSTSKNGYSTFIVSNSGVLVNCYYDMYANAEFTNIGEKDDNKLTAVDTATLQSSDFSKLKGNWKWWPIDSYNTKIKDENGNELALEVEEKDAQGATIKVGYYKYYNYGYPMYSFNQTYYSTEIGGSEYKERSLTTLDKALYTGNGTESSPYLISNIGTLDSINKINKIDKLGINGGGDSIDTSIMHFKLINDINFDKNGYLTDENDDTKLTGLCAEWSGIGSKGKEPFTNEFYSGDREKFGDVGETLRTISSLPNGLFASLSGKATIYNLGFISATLNANGGVLANIVDADATDVTITNVLFGNIKLRGKETESEFKLSGTTGLVFGTVAGKATVDNFNKLADNFDNVGASDSFSFTISGSGSNLGVIAGQVANDGSSGELTVENSTIGGGETLIGFNYNEEDEEGEEYSVEFTTVGGVVGQVLGTLNLDGTKIDSCYIGASSNVGAIAGKIGDEDKEGGIINITAPGGEDITASSGQGSSGTVVMTIDSNVNAGGIVGSNYGTLNLNNEMTINASLGYVESSDKFDVNGGLKIFPKNAGGIAGVMDGSGKIDAQGAIEVKLNGIWATGDVGGLVGQMKGGSITGSTPQTQAEGEGSNGYTISFTEQDGNLYGSNFGGVVGSMTAGSIGTSTNITISTGMIVTNATNIGGAVALASSSNEEKLEGIEIYNVTINSTIDNKLNTRTDGNAIVSADAGSAGGLIGKLDNMKLIIGGTISFSGSLKAHLKFESVGGFIGYTNQNTITDSASVSLSIEELSGYKDVGGFIGHYANAECLQLGSGLTTLLGAGETQAQADGEGGFATIILPTVNNGDSTSMENIGGIFGYYEGASLDFKSSEGGTETQAEGEGEAQTITFINNNKVLAGITDAQTFTESNKSGVTNVGGIAGLAKTNKISGTNKAEVGSCEGNYIGTEYETLQKNLNSKYLNIQNVGGIVGKVEPLTNENGNENGLTLGNLENSAEVKGLKKVGGLVGCIDFKASITCEDDAEITNNADITGYQYIGGLFGLNKQASLSIKVEDSSGAIKGFYNVGGLIGAISDVDSDVDSSEISADKYADSVAGAVGVGGAVGSVYNAKLKIGPKTEDNTEIEAKVEGNANVGGVVGSVSGDKLVTISNITLKANIKPIEYYYGTYKYNEEEYDAYFTPTSIGGFVGIGGSVNFSSCSITGEIKDIEQGKGPSKTDSYLITGALVQYPEKTPTRVAFEDIETGIGGLIGTLSGYNEGTNITPSKVSMDVITINSANVGGLIGYWKISSGLDLPMNKLAGTPATTDDDGNPIEADPVYIAGAMGVGSYVGKVSTTNTSSPIDYFSTNLREGQITLTEVYLQNYDTGEKDENDNPIIKSVFGEYVGGVIGVAPSITAIQLSKESTLTIDNTEGAYYGGLIGFLNGNLEEYIDTGSDSELVNDDKTYYSSVPGTPFFGDTADNYQKPIFKDVDNYNYGGLVGLVEASSNSITVKGEHNYAFTAHTLRTENIDTNQKSLYVDEQNSNIVLTAHMNNKSQISIASSSATIEDNPILQTGETEVDTGWHKEYTMFKTSEVKYKGSDNVTVIVPTYDATNLLKVADYIDNDGFEPRKNYYVIYVNGATPYLYCRYGIASPIYTSTEIKDENVLKVMALERICATYGKDIKTELSDSKLLEILGVGSFEMMEMDWSKTSNEMKEFFAYFRSEKVYLDLCANTDTEVSKALQELILKVYYHWETLNLGGAETNIIFKFDTIFATFNGATNPDKDVAGEPVLGKYVINATKDDDRLLDDIKWNGIATSNEDFTLFKIHGSIDNRTPSSITEKSNWSWGKFWKIVGISLIVIVGAVLAFYGGFFVVSGILGAMLNGGGFAGFIIGGLLAVLGGAGAIAGGTIWNINTSKAIAIKDIQSTQAITSFYEGDYGLITSAYSRPWFFDDGAIVNTTDDTVDLWTNVPEDENRSGTISYLYFSSSRPKDYGEVFNLEMDENIANQMSATFAGMGMYLPSAGDTLPKYKYYNGQYYLNTYYSGEVTKELVLGADMKAYLDNNQNSLYYISEEGSGKVYILGDTTLWNSTLTDLNPDNLIDSDSKTKELSYYWKAGYTPSSDDEKEGLHYITYNYKDLGWVQVRESVALDLENNGLPMARYNTLKSYEGSPVYAYFVPVDPKTDGVYTDKTSMFSGDIEFNYDATNHLVIMKDSYGNDISNKPISYETLTRLWDIQFFGDNEDKELILHYTNTTNDNYPTRKFTYYAYDSKNPANMSTVVKAGKNIPVIALTAEELASTYVFDGSGNIYNIENVASNLSSYYITDITEGVPENAQVALKADNHYVLTSTTDPEGNTKETLCKYALDYESVPLDNGGVEYQKISLKAPEGSNYKENKCHLEIGNITLYTRYNYKDGNWYNYSKENGWGSTSAGEALKEYGLMPDNSSFSGYMENKVNYHISEISMISFNGGGGSLSVWDKSQDKK